MGFESIEFECIDWVESVAEDLIEEIKNRRVLDEYDKYRKEGAICALEELLNIINGN